jgi:putative ABC transport system substrate-binding protein
MSSQPRRTPRIGFLWSNPRSAGNDFERAAFIGGLQELGLVEGQSVHIEWRYPASPTGADLLELATELVALPVDLIVTVGTPPVLAAQRATATLPIVMASIGDPVRAGVVRNLSRPGGNVTGLSQSNPGLSGKRVELIHQIAPTVSHIAFVLQAGNATNQANLAETQAFARSVGMNVVPVALRTVDDLEPGIGDAVRQGAAAVITPGTGSIPQADVNTGVISMAERHRLLSVGFAREFTASGGLLSYGADITWSFRRAGYYVSRILQGSSASDLPIEQPTHFELTINRRTAQQLGLTIPEHVLLLASELIG